MYVIRAVYTAEFSHNQGHGATCTLQVGPALPSVAKELIGPIPSLLLLLDI